MPSEYIGRVAEECGLTPFYIDKKIEETRELAEEKDLTFSNPALIGYDAQGPMVRLVDTNFYPWINVQKALYLIPENDNTHKTILSGWDLKSLKEFRDNRLGMNNIHLIGELGAVFEYGGKIYEVEPISDENIFYEMEQKLFKICGTKSKTCNSRKFFKEGELFLF